MVEIKDTVVVLQLEGACNSCSSSAMTMTMGLERKLKERIPSISVVTQGTNAPKDVTNAEVEKVLDEVRPFLKIAGGEIKVLSLTNFPGFTPTVRLVMKGTGGALASLKLEIIQRLKTHFSQNIRVEYMKKAKMGDEEDED